LALGVPADAFGETLSSFVRIDLPAVRKQPNELIGEIIYIDGFGNLFTNIEAADLTGKHTLEVRLGATTISGLSSNYAAVASGACTALVNSWGLLEIAVNHGDAQRQTGAALGDRVYVKVSA